MSSLIVQCARWGVHLKKTSQFINVTKDQITLESVTQEWRSQGQSSAQTLPQTAPLGLKGQVINKSGDSSYAISFKGKYTPVCPRDTAQKAVW